MTKIIGILASPRRQGNTEIMLDRALEGAQNKGALTEKIVLRELNMSPCIECGGCENTGLCVINDDFQKIYSCLKSNHLFMLASPLFFSGVTAYAKILIDRCQCAWVGKYRLRKPIAPKSPQRRGILLSSRGMPGTDDFSCMKPEVKSFFSVNNIAYFDELLIDDCDGKGIISSRPDIMKKCVDIGKRLAAE